MTGEVRLRYVGVKPYRLVYKGETVTLGRGDTITLPRKDVEKIRDSKIRRYFTVEE